MSQIIAPFVSSLEWDDDERGAIKAIPASSSRSKHHQHYNGSEDIVPISKVLKEYFDSEKDKLYVQRSFSDIWDDRSRSSVSLSDDYFDDGTDYYSDYYESIPSSPSVESDEEVDNNFNDDLMMYKNIYYI
jgi:hypothetical protein